MEGYHHSGLSVYLPSSCVRSDGIFLDSGAWQNSSRVLYKIGLEASLSQWEEHFVALARSLAAVEAKLSLPWLESQTLDHYGLVAYALR